MEDSKNTNLLVENDKKLYDPVVANNNLAINNSTSKVFFFI